MSAPAYYDWFQLNLYKDRAFVFRTSPYDRDASGNVIRTSRIGISQGQPLPGFDPYGQLILKLFSTYNFDTPVSTGLGQKKEQNIDTSDSAHVLTSCDLRPGDFLLLQATMFGQWRKVAGISNTRVPIANYTEVFLSLCDAPPSPQMTFGL